MVNEQSVFELLRFDCSIEDVQKVPQSQDTAYQWQRGIKQAHQDREYTQMVREKSRECHNQAAALPRHQEEEEKDKTKQAQIEQTYESTEISSLSLSLPQTR